MTRIDSMGHPYEDDDRASCELLDRGRKVAKREGATLRVLIEEGLRLAVHARERKRSVGVRLKPFKGDGLTPEFRDARWERIRDEIYGDRG